MSIQNTVTKNTYKGDGTTRTFPYTFAMDDDHPEYIHVYITGTDGRAAETDDFTVDVKEQSVTYPKDEGADALSSGYVITVARELPLTQILNLVNQGPFFAEDLEQEYDDIVCMVQQLNEKLGRAIIVDIGATETGDELKERLFRAHDEAQASAAAAAVSETNAGNSETNAGNSATAANNSALAAEAAVQEAKDISKVFGVAGEPYDPNKTYNFPDIAVLPDGTAYRCLEESTGEYPSMSSKWVPVALAQGETFERDDNGDLMPREHPQSSSMWQIDEDGNIMPAEVI